MRGEINVRAVIDFVSIASKRLYGGLFQGKIALSR